VNSSVGMVTQCKCGMIAHVGLTNSGFCYTFVDITLPEPVSAIVPLIRSEGIW